MEALLSGVRVLESAVLLNGDWVGMLLGDMGADVIKIEDARRGDNIRDILGQITDRTSPAHLQINRNKRSVALDLKSPKGQELFWRLHATADVFVDGFTVGAAARLGIDYEEQRRRKPNIVYCHVTGFGATGPYASIPTHGYMQGALAGAMPTRVTADGLVEQDFTTGTFWGTRGGGDGPGAAATHAALAVAGALLRRSRTGEGCYIDVAGADAVLANGWMGAVYPANWSRLTSYAGLPPTGRGDNLAGSARYQAYQTADHRFVLFCCIEEKFWKIFCEQVDRPDLYQPASEDEMSFGFDQQLRNSLQDIFGAKNQSHWLDLAVSSHLPIGPITQVDDLTTDPHLTARQMFVEGEHPVAGHFTYVASPVHLADQAFCITRPAPAHGEHTDELRRELGLDEPSPAASAPGDNHVEDAGNLSPG